MQVQLLWMKFHCAAVKHTHLQNLVHLEAQTLGFIVNDSTDMFEHGLALSNCGVVEHLCGQRDGGYRCLELMRHVVDEIVLDFRHAPLANEQVGHHHEDDKKE